jgi:hypothetical protein
MKESRGISDTTFQGAAAWKFGFGGHLKQGTLLQTLRLAHAAEQAMTTRLHAVREFGPRPPPL